MMRATKFAATPISATESTSPTMSTHVWSRAVPATASTLSSDIETSAITIWLSAWPRVLVPVAAGVSSRAACASSVSR